MKIGIILRLMTIAGGGERQAIMLAKELQVMGHDVSLYTTKKDSARCFPDDVRGTPVRALLETEYPVFRRNFLSQLPVIRVFFSERRENFLAQKLAGTISPDTEVIIPNDHWGARVAQFFKFTHSGAVSVLMLNDLDLARWSLFDDPLFGRRSKIVKSLKWPFLWCLDYYERHNFLLKQDIIAVLNDRTAEYLKKYVGIKAVVVRSGVESNNFEYRERHPLDKSKDISLFSHGIFYIHRRFEDIIDAVSILLKRGIKTRLMIAGDYVHKKSAEEYYKFLVQKTKDNGVFDRVIFAGAVSEETLKDFYKNSDIFVSVAHLQTWGLAVFEALSSGLPAVISKTIGASEVLTNGENALFTEPADPKSIADAVERLVTDSALYVKVSEQGNQFVRANISWRRYAEAMLALCLKAQEKKHAI